MRMIDNLRKQQEGDECGSLDTDAAWTIALSTDSSGSRTPLGGLVSVGVDALSPLGSERVVRPARFGMLKRNSGAL